MEQNHPICDDGAIVKEQDEPKESQSEETRHAEEIRIYDPFGGIDPAIRMMGNRA